MELLIYLTSPVQAFSMTASQVRNIRSLFPLWKVRQVDTKEKFLAALDQAEICILWYMKEEWYKLAPRLKAIYTPAAGKDWVAADPAGKVSVHHGHFHGQLMSETLMAMILYFNRRLAQCVINQVNKNWERDHLSDTMPLSKQHVVIVGYGAIARHCARVLKGFGVSITGVKRSARDTILDKDADQILTLQGLRPMLGDIDHLVFILPGGKETDGVFSREYFSGLKKGCCLYNLGRANCYQESDLLWALEQGIIQGAGLDVFDTEPLPAESPLWSHPRVLITPHASAVNSQYIPLFLEEFFNSQGLDPTT